jgi:hemoglobin
LITLDPDTAQPNAQLLRTVNQIHDNKAGVYGAVLVEGTIRRGDVIELGPVGEIELAYIGFAPRGTAMSSATANPTLYDRLGGVYSIAAVVDDFIDRVMHNPVLNANAAVDEAHHRVSAAGFKYYVTEMVCWATGGPQKYTGRAMRESHEHLKITESEWVAFCKDFDDTMAKFNVPEMEHKELFAIVQSTKGDIVTV